MNISEGIILALSAFTWFLTFGLKYWWALLIIYLVYKAAQLAQLRVPIALMVGISLLFSLIGLIEMYNKLKLDYNRLKLDSLSEDKTIKSEDKKHDNN